MSARSSGLKAKSHLPHTPDLAPNQPVHVDIPKKSKRAAADKDALEKAKPALAPPAKVEAPPAVGRPSVESLESLWRKIDEALVGPSSIETAIGQLSALGFQIATASHDEAQLKKGSFRLSLDAKKIGAHSALKLELEDKEKKKPAKVGVAIEGTVLPAALYQTMKDRVKATEAQFEAAVEKRGKGPLPTNFDDVKALIQSGASEKSRAKEAAQDAEIQAALAQLQAQLQDLKAKGIAPKKVVIYVDGPDGAGKTSTGAIVMQALAAAGYTISAVAFKGPSAEERGQFWLQRFRDKGLPAGDFEAVLWDRGPAGDSVYAPKTAEDVKKMAAEFKEMEKAMAAEGVLMLKLHIFADPEKQAETFGKRLGRQAVADEIERRLEKSGELTEVGKNQLDVVRHKIDGDDFRALVKFDEYQAKFKRFSQAAGMRMLDATDRHPARLQVIDAFSADLSAWGQAQA
ncbi:MAG: hypothetical protein U1E65_00120 [Myxococcota bacterium]